MTTVGPPPAGEQQLTGQPYRPRSAVSSRVSSIWATARWHEAKASE